MRLRGGRAGGRSRAGLWSVPLGLAIAIAAFFARAWPDAVQFLYLDTGRAHEPMKRFIASELRQGRFPHWNPYSGLGVPLVAGAIDAIQHPFTALLLLPWFDLAFKLWIVGSYLLAALGAYAWARQLGTDRIAASAGALVFALSGFLVSQSQNLQYLTAFAALPCLLAAAHAFGRRGGVRALALVGGASGLCAAAGDPQSWALAAAAAPLLAAMAHPARQGRVGRGVLAAAAVAVGAAPFVLPVVAWLPHTSRARPLLPLDLARWNLSWARLPELVLPDLFRDDPLRVANPVFQAFAGNAQTPYPWSLSIYAGAAVLALAAAAALRSRPARVLLAGAAVALWMSLGPNGGFTSLANVLPVLSGFRYWEKSLVWVALLTSASAAIGVARAAREPRLARQLALVAAGLAAVLAGVLVAVRLASPELASLLASGADGVHAATLLEHAGGGAARALAAAVALALAAWYASRRPGAVAAVALAVVAVGDVALASRHAYVVLPREPAGARDDPPLAALGRDAGPGLRRVFVAFAPNPDRWPERSRMENLLRWGARTLDTPWNVPARVGALVPYTGMVPDRLFSHQLATGFAPPPTVGIWGFSAVVVPDAPAAAEQLGLPPPHVVLAADPELPAFAVEIPHRPRAYLAPLVRSATPDDALAFVLDPRATTSPLVLVEWPVPVDEGPPQGDVALAAEEPDRVRLAVRSDRRALLVLNDAFAPGWTARLDGREAPIVRANYLVRAVVVPQGEHVVEFAYATPGLVAGWAVFAAGAAALAAWAAARRRDVSSRPERARDPARRREDREHGLERDRQEDPAGDPARREDREEHEGAEPRRDAEQVDGPPEGR